jgi:PEGA domain
MRFPAFALFALAACQATFPHGAWPTASLHMTGTPADAVVTIDEEMVGSIAVVDARGVALPEGTHQVSVAAPGYFPWDKLVAADPAKAPRIDLAVTLVPIPK